MSAKTTDWIAEIGKAIAYPEEVPAGATEFTFVIDGRGVRVCESGKRRIASCVLAGAGKAQAVAYLAGLAAGRMMKDDATLAWDADEHALVLWQDVGMDNRTIVGRLEDFLNALDWWMGRTEGGETAMMMPSEFIIRP